MSDIVLQAILSVYKKYKLYKDNDNDNDNVNENDKWVNFVRPLRGHTRFICALRAINLDLRGGITMIILDETKLKNRTIAMIGEDYDMPVSVKSLEYPEWYERELDDIVDRFKFDVDEFKEKLISAIMNGIKIDFKLK